MSAEPSTRPVRIVGLVVTAVLGLIGGFQLGRWTTPAGTVAPHSHPAPAAPGAEIGGLSLSAGGYTLVPLQTSFAAETGAEFVFQVRPEARVVGPMHVVVIRRDLSGYQHLHPTLGTAGRWSTPLTLPAPGAWRAIADFAVLGPNGAQTAITLGADLTVAGNATPVAPQPAATESTVDSMRVWYDGTPTAGTTVPLVFHLAGDPPLEPYQGSLGHLVVVREGDVGYIHVHPDAGALRFWLSIPGPGRYRMFFDYQLSGIVRTAAFTLEVPW